MEKKERLDYIDVCKALAVYLVILGHLVIFNYIPFRFIFAFHMPVFFFVAGMVFGEKSERKLFTFVKAQMRYYLLPYAVILGIGILQCFLIPTAMHNSAGFLTIDNLKDCLYFGHPKFSYFGSAWFLLAMFAAQMIFYGMQRLEKKINKVLMVILWILFFFVALNALDTFSFIPVFKRLPLKVDSALMGVCFMKLGNMFRKYVKFDKMKLYVAPEISILGAVGVWWFGCKNNYYVNMCDCEYARHGFYLAAAICGILMLLSIAFLLQKCRFLQFVGKNTLLVFLSHELIYIVITKLVNRIFSLNLRFQGMDLDIYSVGISLATFAVAVLWVWLYRLIERKIKSSIRKDVKAA